MVKGPGKRLVDTASLWTSAGTIAARRKQTRMAFKQVLTTRKLLARPFHPQIDELSRFGWPVPPAV